MRRKYPHFSYGCWLCGKREFLFKCKYCKKMFCSEHRLPEDHNCSVLEKEKNQERWTDTIKDYKKTNSINRNYNWDKQKIFSYKNSKKNIFWKFFKKYLFAIIMIFLLLMIVAYSRGLFSTLVKTCEDGTRYNSCSDVQPFYCVEGNLTSNASTCGCPYGYKIKGDICEKLPTCSDGSFYSECGEKKPMYCSNGILIAKASICGCPLDTIQQGEECINKYQINPKTIRLSGVGNFVVYGGLNDYLAGLERSMYYFDVAPSTKDFILRDLDNDIQKEYLVSLVDKIKAKTDNPNKQATIAIEMVQKIPYDDYAFKTNSVTGRYPYEVLYDMKGVCMEKSDLMAFLLRELGFGVVIFEFDAESHRAVGIKCNHGNYNTNYCFIESTDSYPVGQIPSNYVGGANIRKAIPEVVLISEGKSFN